MAAGFSPSFLAFFNELTNNNHREWFEENKTRFKQDVQQPLVAFIEAMEPELMKISPYFVADPRLNGGSIFRIYRDTRFSKDKTPYKTHAAAQFRHQFYKNVHTPGFYVHFGTDRMMCGGGIWMPEPKSLLKIRERIRDKPEQWQQVITDKKLLKAHGGVSGDGLSRPPKGFSADEKHLEDIKRKSFFAMSEYPADEAEKANLVKTVCGAFAAAGPLVKFLCDAMEVPY
ncbi:TIGR02453 family protein [Hahella sp. CCB-MM4]|nr:TIGR02453 family protein [Hahella sp. CCB-MM4]